MDFSTAECAWLGRVGIRSSCQIERDRLGLMRDEIDVVMADWITLGMLGDLPMAGRATGHGERPIRIGGDRCRSLDGDVRPPDRQSAHRIEQYPCKVDEASTRAKSAVVTPPNTTVASAVDSSN